MDTPQLPTTADAAGWPDPAGTVPPANRFLSPAPDQAGAEALLLQTRCTLMRAGWWPLPPEWRRERSNPPYHALWVCVGGRGRFQFCGATHELAAGGLLLIPPHVLREGSHDHSDPLRAYIVQYDARVHGVLDAPSLLGLPATLRPSPDDMAEIVVTAARLVGELASRAPGGGLAATADCQRLLALVWRAVVREAGESAPDLVGARLGAVNRLAPVFPTIHARYPERLTLRDLASTVHLEPTYLSALFKNVTGMPPLRYLARYRLDRARDLLLTTDRSIAQIAADTGYASPFHFSHVFRLVEGVSPLHYRKTQAAAEFP